MKKTYNLVIATYNGNYLNSIRKKQNRNNTFKLNSVKCVLENIDQSLYNQITIVIAEEIDEQYIHKEYKKYLDSITEQTKLRL